MIFHVMNRGNARATVFHKDADYAAFENLIGLANRRVPMRVLAYCLMPNHFHLVLWPHGDGDLGRWMQWLLTAHVRRYHRHYGTSGRVWQGRFKAFPVQHDEHLLTVLRYVERNAAEAGLVRLAEGWPWGSAGTRRGSGRPEWLSPWPVERRPGWSAWLNQAQSEADLEALRESANRGKPWGSPEWVAQTSERLGLGAALRPWGRAKGEPLRGPRLPRELGVNPSQEFQGVA